MTTNPNAAQIQKTMKGVMRGMSFAMVPLFIMFPAGLNVYGLSNIIGFAVQSKLMKNDGFRKVVGLKPTAFLQTIQAGNATKNEFGKKKETSVKITVPSSKTKVQKVPVKKESNFSYFWHLLMRTQLRTGEFKIMLSVMAQKIQSQKS